MLHILWFIGIAILFAVASADECPEIYKRFSSQHSYCLPINTSCEVLAFYPEKEEIQHILQLHNAYRSVVATGQEKLEKASNMLEMEWDDELSYVAQNYAQQCIYKHDCANCRRVMNFDVGQNIAMQTITGSHTAPEPDWKFAVGKWFEEIQYFSNRQICPFAAPPDQNEYRHFTQVAWAETYRVGCGYVMYKTGTELTRVTYTRLYFCNYGPAGNTYDECVYKTGEPCSNCPENSCCGDPSCNNVAGLCKRTDDKAPYYKVKQPLLLHCDFRDTDDCNNYILGDNNWIIQPTLSGHYVGTVLGGTGNSTLVFSKKITPSSSEFCVTMEYRKGPNMDGDEAANTAKAIFTDKNGYSFSQPLPGFDSSMRHQFSTFNMSLSWSLPTEVKFSFVVPSGKPEQFFHLSSLQASEGKCQNP